MAEDKKSFLLYADLIHTVRKMPKDKAGELLLHILEYVNDTDPQTDDILINIAFEPIKQQMKRDLSRWEDVKFKRSEAGKASAEAKRLQKENEQKLTKSTSVNKSKQASTNSTVNDTVNVTVTVNDIKQISIDKQEEVLKFFDFSMSPNFSTQQRLVSEFFRSKDESGELDDFISQFNAYRKYFTIEANKKYRHSLVNFLGSQSDQFKNGKWLSENWITKSLNSSASSKMQY